MDKLFAYILLVISLSSTDIVSLGFASNTKVTKVNVDCKDLALALALLTWNQLLVIASDDDIAENEHELNDKNLEPDLYSNTIDDHLQIY